MIDIVTYRTSFSFSTTSFAEISVSAVQAADSVKSSEATMGDAIDDPVVVSRSIVVVGRRLAQAELRAKLVVQSAPGYEASRGEIFRSAA